MNYNNKNNNINKAQYKCLICGLTSHEPKDCCGLEMEKLCSCGSGHYAKMCCEKK